MCYRDFRIATHHGIRWTNVSIVFQALFQLSAKVSIVWAMIRSKTP